MEFSLSPSGSRSAQFRHLPGRISGNTLFRLSSLPLLAALLLGSSVHLSAQGVGNTVRYSIEGTSPIGEYADFAFEWGGAEVESSSGSLPLSFAPEFSRDYAGMPTLYSKSFRLSPGMQAVSLDISYRFSVVPGADLRREGNSLVILMELIDAVSGERLGRVGLVQEAADYVAGQRCEVSAIQRFRLDCQPAWFASGNRTVRLRAVLDVAPGISRTPVIEEYPGRTAAEIR